MTTPVETAPETGRTPFASREFSMRVVSAIVLGAIVVWALLAGGGAFACVWLAAASLGAGEWIAMSRAFPSGPLTLATVATLAAISVAFQSGAPTWVVPALATLGAAALLAIARDGGSRRNAVAGLAAAAVIALVPPALRDDPAIGILGPAWMFAVVWSTDITAYFTGRIVGGPKLMPAVSPKKTWSGALGGLAAGAAAGAGIVLVARSQGWGAPPASSLAPVALASAAASMVSQAGDLAESGLKRRYGVKDSGRSIPGHGGVMDRLDGFFAVAVLAGLYLVGRPLIAP